MDLKESLEPSAVACWGELALGPDRPDVRGRRWPGSWEGEPSSSYTDPVGLVHMRSLSRVYPERTLNHPVLYTPGHAVPPTYPVAISRLYLVKTFILIKVFPPEESKCHYGTKKGRGRTAGLRLEGVHRPVKTGEHCLFLLCSAEKMKALA